MMLLDTRNPAAARFLFFLLRHNVPFLGRLWGIVLGCDISCKIPLTLIMPHPYGVVIHSAAVIGEGVVILHQVTVGAKNTGNLAPIIEDNVFIGAGAKVIGGRPLGRGRPIWANTPVSPPRPPRSTPI